MRSVEEALAGILAQTQALPPERVPLLEARGRVLAEAAIADTAAPPFTNSAVDGYAVRAANTEGATRENPVRLRVQGEVTAGTTPTQTVVEGGAMRVMTGAPMPEGADAMIMVEDTRLLPDDNVLILESAKADQHLRFQGAEVRRGDVVLPAGTRIRPADLGVLATFGYAHPLVHRLPKVAVLSTGDEVVEIDAGTPPFGKIRNSNRYALAGLVEEAGAVLHSLVHISDNLEATESAFRECVASGADVIVTAGGVSVGDRDFVKPALERLGRLEFWKIAMKPGKPLAFGNIGETLFFGLPGNPVSAMVTFELFVRPALWKMAGRRTLSRPQVLSILQDDVPHTPGRREYVRAFTTLEGGVWRSRTTGDQGSSRLRSMTGANALVMVPLESEGLKAGDQAETLLMGDAT